MLLSLSWLREFTPYTGSAAELGERLTMLGLELEEIRHPFSGLEHVVVGKVLTAEPHPQASKLTVCTVDAAQGEILPIVCGAPNVAAGQTVAVALPGAVLPGGTAIKTASLRGVESRGMICAEDELGLGEDHAGILILDDSLPAGLPIAQALNLDTEVIDVGITPNRADCLSVLGLARETALAFGLPLTLPETRLVEAAGSDKAQELMRIEIADPELCPVYRGRVIRGVAIGKSPAWMRYRLTAVGQRPISNIVDVTNYVMLELGQPLHSFDLDLLQGGVIRVARAENGMQFTTLDKQVRKLTELDLLIWDGARPVALAGVMGGANSEIHEGSTNVFLESAVFKPSSVRKTARRLGLPSESSYRFERGVDQPGSLRALARAAALMASHAGGKILAGIAQAEPRPWQNRIIAFKPERAKKLLGLPLTEDFSRKTLTTLGCEILKEADGIWEVAAPSHRLDLERAADLAEELGRVWGLDRLEPMLPQVRHDIEQERTRISEFRFWSIIRDWGRGLGLSEAVNYSFVGQKDLDILGLPAHGRIPVMNPLTEEQNVLRPALAPGLLQTLRHNLAQGASRLRVFELARIFKADPESETTARESGRLGLLLYGPRSEESWPASRNNEDAGYLDLKGVVEHLLTRLRLPAPLFERLPEHSFLSPAVRVSAGGESLGSLGRVRPEGAGEEHGRKAVWLAELDLDLLRRLYAERRIAFKPLPTLPPVRRDITVVAPPDLAASAITGQIEAQESGALESVALVDLFIPQPGTTGDDGNRRLTFRLTFRHPERTLKDKEVDKERDKIVASLTRALRVSV